MSKIDTADLMAELLNKDRLDYIGIINDSKGGIKSIDVTKKILELRGEKNPEKVRKENIKVNKRLRKLVSYGVLVSENGKYGISSLGQLLMASWGGLKKNVETVDKFREYFDNHYVEALPEEFFRQIYKLRGAKMTENPVQWVREVTRYTGKIERKFYNLTEYVHDIPENIIEKLEKKEIEIVFIYEFKKYPELNLPDEKVLFDELVKAGVQFRYITLENRYPIGIRIVDDKWAIFGLAKKENGQLDRDQTFFGDNMEFITWCRDLMYHMWHFEAKELEVDEIRPKKE